MRPEHFRRWGTLGAESIGEEPESMVAPSGKSFWGKAYDGGAFGGEAFGGEAFKGGSL